MSENLDCNHHHLLTDSQEVVDFGSGEFVADVERIPLLKALNECGLLTRTHCYGHTTGQSFISILMPEGMSIEVKDVSEPHSGREFEEMKEILISWKRED